MSNVLIGIIGVILFIGLAIAGASFLGPRFQEATGLSKGAAIVSQMTQIAQAAKMRKVSTGNMPATGGAGITQLISEGYLKAKPDNPMDMAASGWDVYAADGTYNGTAAYILAGVGTALVDQKKIAICQSIQKNSGVDGGAIPVAGPPPGKQGCFYTPPAGWGIIGGSMLIMYRKI
jgi:hypothetical protein